MNRGGQPGNQNAAKAKRWEAAIIRAVEAWPNEPDSTDCSSLIIGLNKAAHGFVKRMIESEDLGFFKEFGDRLDGKATQAIDAKVNGNLVTVLGAIGTSGSTENNT